MTTIQDESHIEGKTPVGVGFVQTFFFTDHVGRFVKVTGVLVAWTSGLCMPLVNILHGRLTNALVKYETAKELRQCETTFLVNRSAVNYVTEWPSNDLEYRQATLELGEENLAFVLGTFILGLSHLILGYLMIVCLNITAQRQVHRIKSLFLRAILRQDIGWFDKQRTRDFASRTAEDIIKLRDGFGEKFAMFNFLLAAFIAYIINAFVHDWKLTLVLLSVAPLTTAATAIIRGVHSKFTEEEHKAYATSGTFAEEVFANIRTVTAFNGQAKEQARYNAHLERVTKAGFRRFVITASSSALFWFVKYACYTLAIWFVVRVISKDNSNSSYSHYDISNLINVFFGVHNGFTYLGQLITYMDVFAQAKVAAISLFEVINRVPPIDIYSEAGLKFQELRGDVEFVSVNFSYPNRPEVQVFDGFSLHICNGETVALVGESGCGKSTVLHLLQRFYDPSHGSVKLDGHDITTLNLGWLRGNIGIVSQEPVLFNTTIEENIRYGLKNATMADVEQAAKEANVHDFICSLPNKYKTLVGEGGAQLSGGQKQRIAIARALVSRPKILLLDEATSALDLESEYKLQEVLDKVRLGRTTIVVAHRLSTIRHANRIAVISKGCVAELGSHTELMALGGLYYTMVSTQDDGNLQVDSVKDNSLSHDEKPSLSKDTDNKENLGEEESSVCNHSEVKDVKDNDNTTEDTFPSNILGKLLLMCRKEWPLLFLGWFGAFGLGLILPAYAFVFGNVLMSFALCDQNSFLQETTFYSYMFLILGVASAIFNFLQVFMLSYGGEKLNERFRKMVFATILKQDISYFDYPQNSVGILCTKLSTDTSNVKDALGSKIGVMLQCTSSLCAGLLIVCILCRKAAIVPICAIPLIAAIGYLESKAIVSLAAAEMQATDKSNKIATEVISNIQTVASLNAEKEFHQMCVEKVATYHRKVHLTTQLYGLTYAIAHSMPFFTVSACYSYLGFLLINGGVKTGDAFKILEILWQSVILTGQAFAFVPNISKGVVSAARVLQMLDKTAESDTILESGLKPNNSVENLEFRSVSFCYPFRDGFFVLKEMNLTIAQHQVIALVGASGCGKTTCINLLQRFYNPTSGHVKMNDTDISTLNVHWWRSRIGLVSQEPVLFDRSIAENIAYGDDNSCQVSMEAVVKAASDANIHHIITMLPQGYDTLVGSRGTQLSVGQRQRIAIARALVRNPEILLLDEVTSAMDPENEKVVLEALKEAQIGRMCVIVTHRLSAIRNANQIAVVHQGKVAEKGTHDQLIALQGHYFKMYQWQTKGITEGFR